MPGSSRLPWEAQYSDDAAAAYRPQPMGNAGLTIILAEHRLERIARYSDRLTWLEAR